MPDSFACLLIMERIAFVFSLPVYPRRTSKLKFGLSNELIKTLYEFNRNCLTMSSLVSLSAVAVNAIIHACGKSSCKFPNWVYSGRKSCPHCEIQCASSIANKGTRKFCRIQGISLCRRSGEIYRIFSRPDFACARILKFSSSLLLLLRAAAAMPLAFKASTWSFIKEISGDTTTVVPSRIKAGI